MRMTRSASGRTAYYVDGRNGRDGNDGKSARTAWRSLGRVNSTVFKAGDRVLFRAGTRYSGRLQLRGVGRKGWPVTVGKYGGAARPRIDGEGLSAEAVLLANGEYWEIADLEITNRGAMREPRRVGIRVRLDDFGTAHDITLKRLFVHDVNGSNVKDLGGGWGIYCTNGGDKVKSRFDGLVIEDCHVVRTDRSGIGMWSDYIARTKWYPSRDVVIRGNLLEDIGGDGIVPIGCDGALVERNVLRVDRRRCDDYAAGIWPWSCDNTIIQFNEVSGVKGIKDGQGFDSDWNCVNTVIQYNYSHDNDGGFVLVCNLGTSRLPDWAGNVGTIVRYNISQNDGERTFQIGGPMPGVEIYNNTIYVGKRQDILGVYMYKWEGWAENTVFRNNIFHVDGRVRHDFGHSRGSVFLNNVFFGNHANIPHRFSGSMVDPLLEAPGRGRDGANSLQAYRLRKNSPCRHGGVVIPDNGGRDFFGNRLPAGAPDIGAHQKSAALLS